MTIGTTGPDNIRGTSGSDHIDGGAGNDTIRGGAGADYVKGGAGNDTFLFRAGDLVPSADVNANGLTNGVQDTIYDFHARQLANPGAEVDFLAFTGFGAGSTLVFDGASSINPSLGYYHVHDGVSGVDYSLAIVNAVAASPLSALDYHFY